MRKSIHTGQPEKRLPYSFINAHRRLFLLLFSTILAIVEANSLHAEIIHVPDDYETIQEAVDNSSDNDTIMVGAGIYNECISWTREPANLTIIGSPDHQSIIDLENQEGRDFAVFVITRTNSVTIENMAMRNLHRSGGIFSSNNDHTVIRNCILQTVHGSTAILIRTGISAIVEYNIFQDCIEAVDISNLDTDPLILNRNLIYNCGQGIGVSGSAPFTIINNTIVGASHGIEFGGVDGRHLLKDNIISDCRMGVYYTSAPGHGDIDEIVADDISIAYNCFWNNEEDFFSLSGVLGEDGWIRAEAFNPLPGTGMIYENPLFVDPQEGDYHLSENSPCIDAGDPESPRDPDGTRADIGAFYFHQGNLVEQVIPLPEGWEIISLYIRPPDDDPRAILRPLLDAEALLFLKDGIGRFFVPEYDYINIPFWDHTQGYLIKMDEEAELSVVGERIPLDSPIELHEGWNMIAFYGEEPLNPEEALECIMEYLIIAKDGSGHFWVVEPYFNNLEAMEPGRGYLVKVREDCVLIYR